MAMPDYVHDIGDPPTRDSSGGLGEGIGAGVHIQSLCKNFGEVRAVVDLTLDIKAGEFVSFLGASGSGKSTVLRMIAGLEDPSSGSIIIAGEDATGLPPEKRDIGMVFQDYALFPHMTLAQNIGFPLRMRLLPAASIAARVASVMKLVGIDGLGARKPAQISGGQQQRVALARAIVFKPKLLLLDEPLSALDKNLREQMKAEIKALHRRFGVTIVYVTHDQSEALALSDRVVVMRHGRIVGVDTPERLYRLPATHYIARFIGEANLIDGRIESVGSSAITVSSVLGKWQIPVAQVRLSSDIAARKPVAIVVRPEELLVEPAERRTDLQMLDCTISEMLYNGSFTQFDLRPRGLDIRLSARGPIAPDQGLTPGDTVRVGLDPNRAVIVDSEELSE
jgi:putative spermidine/putrescine transport system ATP-binding protein